MHVLESLRAQLIALHYMNGFCPNFSHIKKDVLDALLFFLDA